MEFIIHEIIRDIYKEIDQLKSEAGSGTDFTFCFRGEARDYKETKLMPTLFRESNPGEFLKDKELINLIMDYKIVDDENLSPLSMAREGQHFLALSRLLDVTFSILPSLFFACSSNSEEEKNEDALIYIFRFPKTYSPSSAYINSYYKKLINREIIPYYQNFKVLSHTESNNRIKSQSGGFILFPGDTLKKIPKSYYKEYKIKASQKNQLLKELDIFFNINESVVYPEKDKKRNLIKNRLGLISMDDTLLETDTFYVEEVRSALERINFEIHSLKLDDREIYRILRKERHDLEGYVRSLGDEILIKNQEYIDKLIDSEFKKFQISLMNNKKG